MGLAKKGARLLTVEGERYRWVVTNGGAPVPGIVVEAVEPPRQRMVTWLETVDPVAPWLVREAVLHALSQGWHPRASGPERVFRLDEPTVFQARRARWAARLHQLCDDFQARANDFEFVRHLMRYGERVIAFESFCDSLLDAAAPPTLSLAQFECVAEVGEEVGCRANWVALIDLLPPADRKRLDRRLRTLAASHAREQFRRHPEQRFWLQRLGDLLVVG
ncbi:hypothetical protein [Pyxidicoccus xibeiensis]|uniref:hypothetical protein n=1 Tax=Pyxidicoccus xibeiensis TaxID=2906759 RepID=UPI0020A71157|nr:hypothetical protein [Pyxidicoccus xibeiensis]MCP3143211.1 hypothetical protein [Pyxidicoccus xibeiensis]